MKLHEQKFAGFWIRFGANIIDSLILAMPFLIVDSILYKSLTGLNKQQHIEMMVEMNTSDEMYIYEVPDDVFWYSMLISFLIGVLYYAVMTSTKMQGTVGKYALGLKVVDANGERIGFGRSFLRYMGYLPSSLILYIGYLMVGFTDHKQGLHDKIANTYVLQK